MFAGSWNPSLGRFRSPFAFRGHPSSRETLASGLLRLAGDTDVARLELHLLRNFRKYAFGHAHADSVWHWLARGQHRGLPTRLLDWTYSPFVALHFATANLARMQEDGVVWAVNFVAANRYLPPRLARMLKAEGSDTVTADMLGAFDSLAAFDRLARRPFVIFLEPPSLDRRIVNQFALFSLTSSPHAPFDEWLTAHPDLFRRVVIPASLKWEIRDKLDQANINERVLFPGLDGLSRWLTRYYWPKPGGGERIQGEVDGTSRVRGSRQLTTKRRKNVRRRQRRV